MRSAAEGRPLRAKDAGADRGPERRASGVAAVGRVPGPKAYRGWRVSVVGEGAQVLRDQSGEQVTFAPESGYANRFEIDGATLGDARAFVRTAHYWWHADIDIDYRPDECLVTIQPMRLRTNQDGSIDLYDRLWTSNLSPHRCVGE